MKDITDLVVVQIRLFPVDVIPFNQITMKSCIDKVRSDLSLQGVEQSPGGGGVGQVAFLSGEFKGEKETLKINRITIEPRRIILDAGGPSPEVTRLYERLVAVIGSAIGSDLSVLASPLLTVETSNCAVSLDFSFWSLFDETFAGFLRTKVEKSASSDLASASITPVSIDVEINYGIKNEVLKNSRVGISPKRLTIALRAGTTSDFRRYYISSPFDSGTHLTLIRELETSILRKEKAKGSVKSGNEK